MKMNLKLTADELMNVVDAAMDEAMEQELYFDNFGNDNVKEILTIIDAALTAMGIEIVPADEDDDEDWKEEVDDFGLPTDYWSEFDEDNDEDENTEEEEPYNPVQAMLVERNGKLYLKESDAKELLALLRSVVEERAEELPEFIKDKLLYDIWVKFGEDNNIEGVLKGE